MLQLSGRSACPFVILRSFSHIWRRSRIHRLHLTCGEISKFQTISTWRRKAYKKAIGDFQSVLTEEPKKYSTLHVVVVGAPCAQCFLVHLVVDPKVGFDIVSPNKLRWLGNWGHYQTQGVREFCVFNFIYRLLHWRNKQRDVTAYPPIVQNLIVGNTVLIQWIDQQTVSQVESWLVPSIPLSSMLLLPPVLGWWRSTRYPSVGSYLPFLSVMT